MYHDSEFFSVLKILLPNFRGYELEKVILNLSIVTEQELKTSMQTLKILQFKVNSLASGVLQK